MGLRWSSQSHQPSGRGLRVGLRMRPWRICRHLQTPYSFSKTEFGLQNHQRRKKRNRRRVRETDKRKITDRTRERGKERLEGEYDGEEMKELHRGDPERRRHRGMGGRERGGGGE